MDRKLILEPVLWYQMMRTSIDTLWDPTKILEYLPRKAKIQIFDRNLDPTFIIETRTKGISITPWPSDYNWITNQRYKVWTPQGRIPDKFTVLEEPKEEQSLTFSDFYSMIISITMSACYLWGMTENRKYEKRTK